MQEPLSVFRLQLLSVFRVSHAGRLSAPTERDDSAALGPPGGTHSARRSANKTPAGAPRRRPSHLNPAGGGGGGGVGRMQMQLLGGEKEGRGGGCLEDEWTRRGAQAAPARCVSCGRIYIEIGITATDATKISFHRVGRDFRF